MPWSLLLSVLVPAVLTPALASPPDRSARRPACPTSIDDLPLPDAIDRADARLSHDNLIVVRKATRQVARYGDGQLLEVGGSPACWWGGLAYDDDGDAWVGTKTRRGDRKTPEGFYATSDKPWSNYYGAIAVHYPDAADATAGLRRGLVDAAQAEAIAEASASGRKPAQTTRLGGEILLHGGGGRSDWTLGCIGMDDRDIDALRSSLPKGMRTVVLILP